MRRRLEWTAIGWLLSLLMAVPAGAEWVDWIAEANLAFQFDSNVNNAGFSSEAATGLSLQPEARVGRVFQLAENTRLAAMAEIQGDVYHRWNELDSVASSGRMSLSHKFGLGDAPWARGFFGGGWEGVQDGERSGARFELGAEIGKRFSPRLDASFTYQFTSIDGDNGRGVLAGERTDVWDLRDHDFTVEGRFLVTEALLLTVGYGFQHGDLYSNSTDRRTLVPGVANVEAVCWDNVFDGWAFRLKGNAHSPFVSLNYGIGDRWSIDAGYRFRYSESDSLNFTNHIAELTILFRY